MNLYVVPTEQTKELSLYYLSDPGGLCCGLIDSDRFECDHRMCHNEKLVMRNFEEVRPGSEVEHRGWIRTKSPIVSGGTDHHV